MTKLTVTFDPAELQLVPKTLCYRSRLGLAWALGLDDKTDREKLEKAWKDALSNAPTDFGDDIDLLRLPTLDEATRFIESNPQTARAILSRLAHT